MKKLIVMCVGGLILGMGAGTGAAWVRRPPPPEPAEHAAAEPVDVDDDELGDDALADGDFDASGALPAGATHGTGDGATLVRADTEPVPLTGPGEGAAAPRRPAGPVDADTRMTAGGAAVASGGTTEPTEVERLSQIFGTMKPQEAARVLERLDDVQVRSLLLGLSDRKAAAILASLPAERAAALTRSILVRNEP